MKHLMVVLVAVCLLTACGRHHAPPAAKPDAARLATIPEQLKEFVDRKEVSGAVVAVATPDAVVYRSAFGKADVAQNRPMRPDTLFWIASMSKPITATAVLMLQDDGKLNVNDPVGKYIPELANLKTPSGKPANLTLHHLLTHTSGLAEATAEQEQAAKTLADLIPAYAAKPTAFEPGAKWSYSQSGINTLARIVEVVSGKSFPDFLDQRLFKPLGMKDTTFYPTEAQAARIATPYKTVNNQLEPDTVWILRGHPVTSRDRYPAANGGLFSTASDYARFCRMLLNDGSLDGKRYLKPETVRQMATIQTNDLQTGFTNGNAWGLGVCIVRQPQGVTADLSPGSFGHGGAFGTQAWIDPARKIAYILMVQRSNFPNADASDVRRVFQATAASAFPK